MKKNLLVHRNYSGMGDWIMAMTVLKMINQQFPDIDIYLNVLAKNRYTSVNHPISLPPIVREIVRQFDVIIKDYTYYQYPEKVYHEYDYVSGNLTYVKDGKNFIKGMVDTFNRNSGLNLKYDSTVYAKYLGDDYDNTLSDLSPYVLIQSCSKDRCLEKNGKDYGFKNMVKIAESLGQFVNIVQTGLRTDYQLPNAVRFLGVDLNLLHKLMVNSLCFVGLDGGLGVYASHHRVRNYIIYRSSHSFPWTNFPCRVQINGTRMGALEVGNFIIHNLRGYNAETVWKNDCPVSSKG